MNNETLPSFCEADDGFDRARTTLAQQEQVVRATAEDVRNIINARRNRSRKIKAPKPLPSDVTLEDIIKSLPSEVFTQNRLKSFGSLFVTIFLLSASMYLLKVLPWYLWPVGWVLGGASVTGLFTIAHDCVHSAFAKTKMVNYIVGTIAMLPLGYSFYSWKTYHKYHALHSDVAKTAVEKSSQVTNYIWKWAKGKTYWLASICYWVEQQYSVNMCNPQERMRVRISFVGLYVFAALFFSLMWYIVGILGIVKYWLLPWLMYHMLVSTTTLLPSVVLEEKGKEVVVHCDYPKWLEFLCNDITLNVPRNVSTSIPHYNLRKAHKALKQQWGEYFLEIDFEWSLVFDLMKSSPNQTFTPIPHMPVAPPADGNNHHHGNIAPVPPKRHGLAVWRSNARAVLANINWLHAGILIPIPIMSLYGLIYIPITTPTFIWAFIYYFLTGLGITAGYHRLFAHRGYSARQPFKFIIMMLGAGAVEGSVRWWCRDHRAHHRYTDTDKDPYNAHEGFWYAHMGWMLVKQDPSKIGKASIEDLNQDPWIRWQHRNYIPIATFMGIILPTVVAGVFWGDWMGGYFHAALLRLTFVHHSTFMVNSLAHYLGTTSFADNHTPRDSIWTAFLTFGEGYHNFHHEFPSDYRNAIKFYQYDPTKWLIKALSYIGQTYDLKKFPENEIRKGQLQMRQKLLNKVMTKVDWGLSDTDLPLIDNAVFDEMLQEGYKLIVVDSVVHDVTQFVDEHPGGRTIIQGYVGKDATLAFRGAVYEHSNGANNLLSQMRVARVDAKAWDARVYVRAALEQGEMKKEL